MRKAITAPKSIGEQAAHLPRSKRDCVELLLQRLPQGCELLCRVERLQPRIETLHFRPNQAQSGAIRCNQAHLQPRLETFHVAQRVEVALDATEGLRLASVLLEDLELFRGGQAPEHG